MKRWRVAGWSRFEPPPAHWRTLLAERLGERPRRLGAWSELALFGALSCLADAGEAALPSAALLSLATTSGPKTALLDALTASRHDLPMPIGFLQSQPALALPALARHLGPWRGNGRCLNTRDPLAALRLACAEADGAAGLLIGWVDEDRSVWLRVVAEQAPENATPPGAGDFADLFADGRRFAFAANDRLQLG